MEITQGVQGKRCKRPFSFKFYRGRESCECLFSTVKFYTSCPRGYSRRLFLVWISYWSTMIHRVLHDQPYILGIRAEMSFDAKAT